MADNELQVKIASGATKTLRSFDIGGAGIHAEGMFVEAMPEAPASVTGATIRHTVGTGAVITLDPPDAGARYARIRVYEATQSAVNRLYYRQDGTNPTNDGANAPGYLFHGEVFICKLATFINFKMIAGAGSFEVYVEWLNTPSS